MIKAVFLDYSSLAPGDLDFSALLALAQQLGIELEYWDATRPEQTQARIAGAQLVFSNKVVLDAALLRANPQLQLIVILATGTNNVDLDVARALGIQVSNIRDYSTSAVVQHCWALLLALQTKLLPYQRDVSAGKWAQSQFFGLLDHKVNQLEGKTLGLVGRGAIGLGVAKIAEAFGMQVLWAQSLLDPNSDPQRLALDELAAQVDVLSLHCPLSQLSRNLVDAKLLARMKPTALLLNVSRGGLVNEADLLAALEQGQIAGAALDVLECEPPQADHPLLCYQARHGNLLITPHSAWSSVEARQNLVDQLVSIVSAWRQGQVVNGV